MANSPLGRGVHNQSLPPNPAKSNQNTDVPSSTRGDMVLLSTSLVQFISGFAQSAIILAIPTIGSFFRASLVDVIWISSGSLFAVASLQATFGKVADIKGRKIVTEVGLILFVAGSILTAVSPSIIFLIVAQVINGIGGAAISAGGTALLAASFPSAKRGRVIGINVMSGYAGLGVGPLLSGIIIDTLGWRSIFYFPILICVPAMILLQIYVKERVLQKALEFDFSGATMFSIFLLTLMMIVTSVTPEYNIALVAVCLVSFVSFILIEKRASNPLLDLELFRSNRTFVIGNLTAFLNFLSSSAYILVLSIYLQVVVGYSPVLAGTYLLLPRFVMMAVVPFSGTLADRMSSRLLGSTGMVVRAVGFLLCAFLGAGFPVQDIWLPLVLIGIGQGSFSAPNTQIVLNSVTSDKLGMASGALGTMITSSISVGVGLLGAVVAANMPAGAYAQISEANASSSVSSDIGHLFVVGMDQSFLLFAVLLLVGMAVYVPRDKKSRQYQAPVS